MKRIVLSLLMLSLVAACAVSVNKSILAPNPTGAVFAKDDVLVYNVGDAVPEHTELANLSAQGSKDVVEKLREEAGKLGGNAIILQWVDNPSGKKKFTSSLWGKSEINTGQAIAIYVPSKDKPRE